MNANEASVNKPKKASPEHIGHTLIEKESKASEPPAEERKAGFKMHIETLVAPPASPNSSKNPDTMSRADLLKLAETIQLDGSNLKKIYETHLIGERGLRRMVAEALKGHDLHKALRSEVIEREMDFERDPALRTVLPAQIEGASTAKLEDLLNQASQNVTGSSEEAAFFKAQARYEAAHKTHQQQRRRILDIGMATTIALLLLLVIVLFLFRG